MYTELKKSIAEILSLYKISETRGKVLKPLINYIQKKVERQDPIALNFICTHNSRRSHLSQLWAQVAAAYFEVPNVCCYSGGTEETALFPKVAETLSVQGFSIVKIADTLNPIYAIKYDENSQPILGFSKKYDHPFNPTSNFAAIMTCSNADQGCPFVSGATLRIPITYEDPKQVDGTTRQDEIYRQRSQEIAAEMLYIFSMIKK
ncbi:protein-tyrosine-phosphatase [Sphingobacterium siyangense]|uniref:arsenate-mycothiol transferase ArsC n=1 Tax=Sphingobacterium siyangense TaxID=459529 RepID=UPI002FDA1A94